MKFVPNKVSATVARQALKMNKNAPTLLFVGGVAGVVATTVLACRATLKLEGVIDESQQKMAEVNAKYTLEGEENSKAHKKELTGVYVGQVGQLTKLYGPSVILGTLSIAALTKSHDMLNKRNAAVVAAYTAVSNAFEEYRARVREEFGEEKEREIRYAGKNVDVVVEGKNGPKTKQEMKATNLDASPYAVFFGPDNENWSPLPEYNIMFIRLKQNWLNDMLKARGHVLLNDAYDALGMPRTHAGSVVGWVKGHNPRNPDANGYIDFGCFDDEARDRFHSFLIGEEGDLLLDFNVDGPVNDLI